MGYSDGSHPRGVQFDYCPKCGKKGLSSSYYEGRLIAQRCKYCHWFHTELEADNGKTEKRV